MRGQHNHALVRRWSPCLISSARKESAHRLFGIWVLAAFLGANLPQAVSAQVRSQAIEAPSWRSVARFRSEAEFQAYLRDVRAAARRARSASMLKQQGPEDRPPELYPCLPEGGEDSIVVTGSRLAAAPSPSQSAPSATSITNVQNAGVDEGDIVKLYGRFLIVLQDGRLFSVDTGAAPGQLVLVDRVNVYRRPDAGVWYDEILISDNRLVVTGYNYSENATEFSVFVIGAGGRFTREAVYFLSSDDYYDSENYATRLVNGNLVIYTPLAVGEMQANARPHWPIVRRWLREGDQRRAVTSHGRNLFDATDIYRPIQSTFEPVVHTISVCPLGAPRAGDELECDSTAIVAPPGREFYVSTSHIYLWTWPTFSHEHRPLYAANCDAHSTGAFDAAAPAALFQIPLTGSGPRAQFLRGRPSDQLSMDANAREFRALDIWQDLRCLTRSNAPAELPLRYVSAPLSAFSTMPRAIPERRYTPLPSVGGAIENRFTDAYLVYGGRENWDPTHQRQTRRRYAPRVSSPCQLQIRARPPCSTPSTMCSVCERVGDNAIITGYRDWRGLSISLIDLRATPRLTSTAFLPERYEFEGRSHAFNAAIDVDGSGLMGLPTVMRRAQSGRWWWRSAGSDVSYIALDRNGQLRDIGALRGASPKHSDYQCEVSCIDWYGNTRALFIAGRVFGLTGTELIEGELTPSGIRDRARVNLTNPVPRH